MRNRKHTRGLSLLLCAALLAGQLGTTVYAEGSSTGNREVVCEHHPEHTEACGYMEAEPGQPCQHQHTGDCYTDELICGFDDEDAPTATDSDATTVHEHTQECYALDCPHERGEHDEDCGYVEPVKGHPCGFVCDECGNKELEADNGNNPPAPETDLEQPEEAAVFTITDFDGLDEAVQYQTISPGTKLDMLNLPATLGASGYTVGEDTEPAPIIIGGVTWKPDMEYDDTAEQGGYTFTPVLPAGYTREGDVALPEIYVRIGAANVTLANDIDDYNTDDVAAFQAILDEHTSLVSGDVKKNDPASWTGLVAWDESNPKRITKLYLGNPGLSGTLDVSRLTQLTYLDCSANQLTALDVSGTALTSLYCAGNKLKTLDGLGSLTQLDILSCSANQLTALDVSGTALTQLLCSDNNLESLSGLGSLTQLTSLDCSNNNLETLDGLGSLTNLTFLYCDNNDLTMLDLSGLSYLDNQYSSCENNPFASFKIKDNQTLTVNQTTGGTVWTTDFDFSNSKVTLEARPDTGFSFREWGMSEGNTYTDNPVSFVLDGNMTVEAVFVGDNPDDVNNDGYHDGDVTAFQDILDVHPSLVSGDVKRGDPASWTRLVTWDESNPKRIKELVLDRKNLTGTLDVSSLTALTHLFCSDNDLTALNVSKNTALAYLFCSNNDLTALDLSKNTLLNELVCYDNDLTALDLSKNTLLTQMNCFGNNLTALDLSKNTLLTELYCDNNDLTSLYLSKNTQLTWLYCSGNDLTAPDLSKNTQLTGLYCSGNNLTSLDLSKNTLLNELVCYDNDLTALDLSKNTLLTQMNCSGNNLTSLDLSKNTQMTVLACSGNNLTSLDLSKNTLLTQLACYDNDLTALDLSKNTLLYYLACSNNPLTSFTPKDGHTLTVNKTTGGTVWTTAFDFSNNKITLEARPDTDFSFQEWTKLPDGITSTTDTVSFTLDGNMTVAANFKGNYTPSTDATLQTLSLSDGITLEPAFNPAIMEYKASVGNNTDTITITATPGDSKAAVEGDGEKKLNEGLNEFTITVTAEDKTSSQNYIVNITREKAAPPSGGGSSSGGDDSSQSYTITTPQPPKPNNPVLAEIELPVTVGNGTATGQLDDARTARAIAEAQKNARAGVNGIALQYRAKTSTAYDGFSITIRRATLERFIDAKVKYVTLDTGIVDLTFDLAALQEIQKQTTGDIILTATRENGLTGDALAAVGTRPTYRLAVGYTGQDGTAAVIQNFGAGRVTVGLAYKPADNEQTGSLFLVYSKDGKEAQWLYQSSYDLGSGNVIGSTGHFSVYGVGYKPAPAFADTVNHWAKADIDFVTSRGLLAGTGETTFTPDGTMTRGMFVVALGRLAGIDPAAYPSSRFSDVAATAYYAPYVEWAASKGIVTRTSETTFAPDATITREQMAVIMQRYANQMGYTLPVAREAELFTDSNKISSGMKEAVQAMQQAGVMNGKGSRLFAPKDTATRAEAAAVLRRFVEIVIDPGAAGGWGQNDAGSWLYYENNKPVTGWKQIEGIWYYFDAAGLMQSRGWRQIGGKWYYFYADGSMAANTEIDGYQIGPDGARNS